MKMFIWNFEKQDYEPYTVPKAWIVKTFSIDMDAVINCASCGRELKYGRSYTSRKIHTKGGFGFMVCKDCYDEEWKEELEFAKHRM